MCLINIWCAQNVTFYQSFEKFCKTYSFDKLFISYKIKYFNNIQALILIISISGFIVLYYSEFWLLKNYEKNNTNNL
jgi:hypothetical protein